MSYDSAYREVGRWVIEAGPEQTPPTTCGPAVNVSALLAVLADVRGRLARPDADFAWSSFADADAALAEMDELAAKVRAGGAVPLMLTVLFAATGPIQEVALSSGWGDEFLVLAARFDAAVTDETASQCPPY